MSHSVVSLFLFLLTFDSSIVTLININIIYDRTFVIFGGLLVFTHIWQFHSDIGESQHHIWPYFCHIRWFHYFFSHIWLFNCQIRKYQHHNWLQFFTFNGSFIFLLIFDSFIVILYNTNITYDHTFVTLGGSIILYSHLTVP